MNLTQQHVSEIHVYTACRMCDEIRIQDIQMSTLFKRHLSFVMISM